MPERRPRVAPPVYVDNPPVVTCDADGVLLTNQLGDTIHSWRFSRHKALNMAALIVAAVSKWERERNAGGNVTPFDQKKLPPPAHG